MNSINNYSNMESDDLENNEENFRNQRIYFLKKKLLDKLSKNKDLAY